MTELHPWHLWAYTHLAALAKSWPMARAAAGRVTLAASDGLRSTIYGRTSTGGHSDGGMLAAVESGVDEWTRWRNTLDRVADNVTDALWFARACTPLQPARGPLGILARTLPSCTSGYAHEIAVSLRRADRTARHALNLAPDQLPLPGVTCPTCETRLLTAHTVSPHRAAWTVTCGARCHTDGAPSIWRWTVIAARTIAPAQAAA